MTGSGEREERESNQNPTPYGTWYCLSWDTFKSALLLHDCQTVCRDQGDTAWEKKEYLHSLPKVSTFLFLPIQGKMLLGKTKSNKSRRNTLEGSALKAAIPAHCKRILRKCPSMSHTQHRFGDVIWWKTPVLWPALITKLIHPIDNSKLFLPSSPPPDQRTSNLKLRGSALLSPATLFSC